MINRPYFFASVRASLFGGRLRQGQVDGCEQLLGYPCADDRRRAYILATAFHETGRRMQPVREVGRGKGKLYGLPDPETGETYYGRGLVQITWKRNYDKMGEHLGVDLVHAPDKALELAIAVPSLYDGMHLGMFTGKSLGQYITPTKTDFVNARRVVNGLDRARIIARYAEQFHAAISYTDDEPERIAA